MKNISFKILFQWNQRFQIRCYCIVIANKITLASPTKSGLTLLPGFCKTYQQTPYFKNLAPLKQNVLHYKKTIAFSSVAIHSRFRPQFFLGHCTNILSKRFALSFYELQNVAKQGYIYNFPRLTPKTPIYGSQWGNPNYVIKHFILPQQHVPRRFQQF